MSCCSTVTRRLFTRVKLVSTAARCSSNANVWRGGWISSEKLSSTSFYPSRRWFSDVNAQKVTEAVPTTSKYSPEELRPGRLMLVRIEQELRQKNVYLVLPDDEKALEDLLLAFKFLIDQKGVDPVILIDTCIEFPSLITTVCQDSKAILDILYTLSSNLELSYEQVFQLFASYEQELWDCGQEGIQERLDAIISCGVPSGKALSNSVLSCPEVLFGRDPIEMKKVAESLNSFFSRKEISLILQRSPQVLLKNITELEEKYEYMHYQMNISGEEFTICKQWPDVDLETIMQRHEFLVKCGKYTMPNEKQPQLKMENPDLSLILDSTDTLFATQIAGVSLEEWIVYQSLCTKLASSIDKIRSFERVKPSLRKAYERRHKAAPEKQDHVFDESS